MLKNFQGDSWGWIPPLRMPSLLPHDLCHGRSSSRWLLAVTDFQLSYSRSWKMMLWKVLHSAYNMHSICNMPAPGIGGFLISRLAHPRDWCEVSNQNPRSYGKGRRKGQRKVPNCNPCQGGERGRERRRKRTVMNWQLQSTVSESEKFFKVAQSLRYLYIN